MKNVNFLCSQIYLQKRKSGLKNLALRFYVCPGNAHFSCKTTKGNTFEIGRNWWNVTPFCVIFSTAHFFLAHAEQRPLNSSSEKQVTHFPSHAEGWKAAVHLMWMWRLYKCGTAIVSLGVIFTGYVAPKWKDTRCKNSVKWLLPVMGEVL